MKQVPLLLLCVMSAQLDARWQVRSLTSDLSEDDLREALAAAPEPPRGYELFWTTGTDSERRTVIGSAYTPFLRVAMWSHQQRQSRHEVTATEIPAALLEPVLVVAVRTEPPCCPAIQAGAPAWTRAVLIAREGSGDQTSSTPPVDIRCAHPECIEPVWQTTDLRYLRQFDEETAARTSFIAAFPLKYVRGGGRVGVEHHFRDAAGDKLLRFYAYGRISPEEARQWR